jgi:hypothetical protein
MPHFSTRMTQTTPDNKFTSGKHADNGQRPAIKLIKTSDYITGSMHITGSSNAAAGSRCLLC